MNRLKRRDFLKGLGSLLGGLVATKVVKPDIVEDFKPLLDDPKPEPPINLTRQEYSWETFDVTSGCLVLPMEFGDKLPLRRLDGSPVSRGVAVVHRPGASYADTPSPAQRGAAIIYEDTE